MPENKERRSCENCGNARCANSLVAYLWDYCVVDGFTKYWKSKEDLNDERNDQKAAI